MIYSILIKTNWTNTALSINYKGNKKSVYSSCCKHSLYWKGSGPGAGPGPEEAHDPVIHIDFKE